MHNHTYVDRGIIKWAPFDALVGFGGILSEMRYNMFKREKPILSDDQFDDLNRKINLAFHMQIEIQITYFSDGYTKTTCGYIKKIDSISRLILLAHYERIQADDIMDINLQDTSI